jgi:hypothetical protein
MYVRPRPVGLVERLPPVVADNAVQQSQYEMQAPTTYLLASQNQKEQVVTGFAKSLFVNIPDGELDSHSAEMIRDLELVQALRSELTSTRCNYFQVDEKDRMCKKLLFTLQSNQNSVDSNSKRFLTLNNLVAYL